MPPKRKSAAATKAKAPATPETKSSSRRRSQRISSSATKSHYFDGETESEDEIQPPSKKLKVQNVNGKGAKRVTRKEASSDEDNYQDDDDDEEEDQDEQDEDEATSSESPPPKKGLKRGPKKGSKATTKVAKVTATAQSDDESSFDEDAPPKVTFIPLPKLRDTDGIPYADDRLHKNTLSFLSDLKANNKRSWLKSHDPEYRRSLKDWESYATTVTDKIMELDPTIPELPFKDINFRIYRDIRFSNDPTPYKPHYAAAWSRTGRKGPYACYYIHVEPGHSFVGGGLWHPDGESVQRLRASIDERPRRWRRVLTDPTFTDVFFPEVAKAKSKDREAVALKAFAAKNQENALKTKPKGFLAEHRDIELLKLRNFTVGKKVDEGLFTREGGQDEVVKVIGALVGFVTHLNRVVRPDPGDDDEESDEE
ncbi:hypothetical protein OQA88_10035 [Cercophora sp. LCS_1]